VDSASSWKAAGARQFGLDSLLTLKLELLSLPGMCKLVNCFQLLSVSVSVSAMSTALSTPQQPWVIIESPNNKDSFISTSASACSLRGKVSVWGKQVQRL